MTTHRRKHDRHTPRGWFSLFIRMGGWLAIIAAGILFLLTLISATQLFLADQLDRGGFTNEVQILYEYRELYGV